MNAASNIIIRPARPEDFEDWSRLYHGYARFYKVPMNDTILDTVWSWIMDPAHEIEGLMAFIDTDAAPCSGLAHIRRMPSPLRGTDIGFLDDLFVAPEARGMRIGERLFEAIQELARERGWTKIRWITADDNYRARNLYDRISAKTQWNTYEMPISS